MREAMITSIAGLVGVLVGGWLGPIFNSRTMARNDAHLAARLARTGLHDWVEAVKYSQSATSRLDHSNFDIELAILLSGLRRSLDLRWWEDNRTALLRRANQEDEQALEQIAKICRFILWRMDLLGDAGQEANARKAKASIASSRRLEAARAARASREGETTTPHPPDDPGDPLVAKFEALAADLNQKADKMDEELEGLKVRVAGFDKKVAMARDLWDVVNGIEERLTAAVNACNTIERENQPWLRARW